MWGFWILFLLVIALIAAAPTYPYSRSWGYWPSGIIAVLLVIWLFFLFLGIVAFWWPWAPPVAPV